MIAAIHDLVDEIVWGKRLAGAGLPGKILLAVLRYLYAMLRDFFSGQLTMRAMSLVYTTLLSLVPLLAFSFALLKGLGVFSQLEPYLSNILAPLGDQGVQITAQILSLVDNVKGSVLGGVGLAFFLYTAISTIAKIEESFNYVWYVSKPGNFSTRFAEYLVVLLVGPIVMVTAIGMLTSIQSNSVVQYLINNEALGPIFVTGGKVLPYVLISAVFTFLYVFLPNTEVRFKSALVGGVASGVMWAAMGAVFATFVLYASRTQQIYAGFAVAITTLIWLYLNWLILLIGAQLAFYHQNPAFLRIGRQEPRLSNGMRERLALDIMFHTARAFRNSGEILTVGSLSTKLRIPSIALAPILAKLEAAGLLKITGNDELLPGQEVARIKLQQVLEVVRDVGETGSHRKPSWSDSVAELGKNLDSAVVTVVAERTLADLLDEDEQRAKK